MPDDLLTRAAARLRDDAAHARALDEHLDGHERPHNPADPTDPAVVAARCDATADLLDALQTPAERLDQHGVRLRPDVYPIDRAIVAATALARVILRDIDEDERGEWRVEWGSLEHGEVVTWGFGGEKQARANAKWLRETDPDAKVMRRCVYIGPWEPVTEEGTTQ